MKVNPGNDLDLLKILTRLQEEFLATSARGDGPMIRLSVPRAAVLTEDGSVDYDLLKMIDDAVIDGREIVLDAEWDDHPEVPQCSKEIIVCRYGDSGNFFSRFEELAGGTIHTLSRVAPLAKQFGLQEENADIFSLSSFWLNLLMTLGMRREHPVVFAAESKLRHEFHDGSHDSFSFGSHALLFRSPDPDMVGRMKQAAKAGSTCQELECGILRGSAYAIDWLLGRSRQQAAAGAPPVPGSQ